MSATRVEALKEIIALEEERLQINARLGELCEQAEDLYRAVPLNRRRKNAAAPAADRVGPLKALLAFEEERARIRDRLKAVNGRLLELRRAMPPAPGRGGKPRIARGELRRLLTAALRGAGPRGLRVEPFCKRRGLDPHQIRTALGGYIKQKSLPGLERLARGHYAIKKHREP